MTEGGPQPLRTQLPFRNVLFWCHLVTGLAIGLVVLVMSSTGVVLTYQEQMTEWADREHWVAPRNETRTASPSALVRAAEDFASGSSVASLTFRSDPVAPVAASVGGGRIIYLDPSDASVRGENDRRVGSFFSTIVGLHRWFGLSGDARFVARGVTGWSNLFFLFLILTGLYLWVPRRWTSQHVRAVLLFKRGASGKARDFNWHHVVGFWTSLPLALVVASATVISFPWASDLVIRAGNSVGGEAGGPPSTAQPAVSVANSEPQPFTPTHLDRVLEAAMGRVPGWRSLQMNIPSTGSVVAVTISEGWGGQPQKSHSFRFEGISGREVSASSFEDQPRGRQWRTVLRFAHTGEYFGIVGQTAAGLVTLLSLVLVWTGFALAWRRLVRPLLRR